MSSEMQHSAGRASPSNEDTRQTKRRKVSRDCSTRSANSKRSCAPPIIARNEGQDGTNNSGLDSEQHQDEEKQTEEGQGEKNSVSNSKPKWPIPDEREQARIYNANKLRSHQEFSIMEQIWGVLRGAVNSLVLNNFPRTYQWEDLSKENQAEIGAWASHAHRWIENPFQGGTTHHFFTAWVFRLLYDHLFSPDCEDKWACETWRLFHRLQRVLREHLDNTDIQDRSNGGGFNPRFHNWRHMSAEMTLQTTERRWHTDPSRLKGILMDRLGPLLSDNHFKELDENLYRIIHKAIELDFIMIYSNLWLKMEMKDPNSNKIKDFLYYLPSETAPGDNIAAYGYTLANAIEGLPQITDFICCPSFSIWGRPFLGARTPYGWILPVLGQEFHVESIKPSPLEIVLHPVEKPKTSPLDSSLTEVESKSLEEESPPFTNAQGVRDQAV